MRHIHARRHKKQREVCLQNIAPYLNPTKQDFNELICDPHIVHILKEFLSLHKLNIIAQKEFYLNYMFLDYSDCFWWVNTKVKSDRLRTQWSLFKGFCRAILIRQNRYIFNIAKHVFLKFITNQIRLFF